MSSRGTPSQDAGALYTRATKAELSGDFSLAFKLYLKSAEEFLHLSRTVPDPVIRGKWKAEAAKALGRAEKIKAKKEVAPVISDPFSEREQHLVLHKSSVVNGRTYPVWSEYGLSQLVDLAQPDLSDEQIRQSASWRNPAAEGDAICTSADFLLPEDVSQHTVSDCSVCASIVVCIAHNRAFSTKLGLSSLYPQDNAGLPVATREGTHAVRILFNGIFRRVDIDSSLPCHSDGPMCISTGQKREIWPALLEKAYMKLMGGYEFPGSLSSTDLYTLVGWIPEHVDIASPHFEREKTWSRLSSAFLEGRCMLTLGTGSELRNGAVETMALLPAHSYAVIDITDNEDDRTLVILDPWKDSAAPPDIDTQTAQEMIKLSLDDSGNDTSRIFRVPWDTVCTVFDGVYLSWDPKIFSHQLSFHGAWRKDASTQGALPSHIQLGLRVSRDELGTRETEVWLLLTRHVVDTKRSGEFISFSVHDQGSTSLEVLKGEYTNNTQVLVRVLVSDPSLSLVASYDGPYDDVGFTVMVYSSFPVSWNTEMNVLAYSEKVAGAFTSKNAGGNPSLPSFMVNPQYHLRIHADYTAPRAGRGKKVQIKLSLQGERRIPLNILAIWSQGQRVTDFAQSDVAISSGAYTYGHAFATKEVLAGDYTMVVSAFDNRHLGTFAFNIDCSTRFDLKPIPQEGAGMFSKVIRGEWTTETAAGAPKFERYKHNPIHELKLPSQSQVLIRLQLANPGIIISLNVTLFLLTSAKSLGSLVATSGPYADSVCGVVLGPITAQAGSYAIVPSTFNPGVCTSFRLLVFTSSSGTSIASVTVCR